MTTCARLVILSIAMAATSFGCPVAGECEPGAHRVDGACLFDDDGGPPADGGTDARVPADALTDGPDIDGARDADHDAATCASPKVACGTDCVDLMTDPLHCGGCDNGCDERVPCVRGECLDHVVQLALGASHSCARRPGGRVACWGSDDRGQLGDGMAGGVAAAPRDVMGLVDAIDLACGANHCCAVRATRTIVCWGANDSAQLSGSTPEDRPMPVLVGGVVGASDVAAGLQHTCAMLGTGDVRCWGRGDEGQIGDGMMAPKRIVTSPATVAVTDAASIAAGGNTSCGVHAAGHVSCWGDGLSGQFGEGLAVTAAAPRAVGRVGTSRLAIGADHICGLVAGRVECAGANGRGQLGDGTRDPSTTLVAVGGITDAIDLAAGGDVTCVVLGSGQAACWGDNYYGAVGDGTPDPGRMSPSSVVDLDDAVTISTGGAHSCAARRDGRVSCWGPNFSGELGSGTMDPSRTPVEVLTFP